MITQIINSDIFKGPYKHIAFAINTEGINDGGFAGQVASRYAPSFLDTGKRQLGEMVTAIAGDRVFYGIVCHSPIYLNGWENAPEIITTCIDKISINEPIAAVLMGSGEIGRDSGSNVIANLKAIHQSKKSIALYTFEYDPQQIFEILNERIVDVTEFCPLANQDDRVVLVFNRIKRGLGDKEASLMGVKIYSPFKNEVYEGVHVGFAVDGLEFESTVNAHDNTFGSWAKRYGLTASELRALIERNAPK